MTPKDILHRWLEYFNNGDAENISNLYAEQAINHQVANEPIIGKSAIREMFASEFANANMHCIPENIFEDGQWVIMEWIDPKKMRGCGFFQIQNDKIIFQRGYWDKISFHKLYNIPLDL